MENVSITTVIIILLVVWLAGTNVMLISFIRRYRTLTKGIKRKELRELLEKTYSQLKKQKETTNELAAGIEKLTRQEEKHLQKVGFIRFNPFIDTGGNQSFCLAFLDRHDNGIVISSLHSREQTRLYAKAVTKGKAEGQELSKEEKEAVKKAQKSLK